MPRKKRMRINLRSISLLTIVTVILFLGSLGLFALITHEIVLEKEEEFDHAVFQFLEQHTTPFMIRVSEILAYLGSPYFFLPAYFLIIGWLLVVKRKPDALHVAIIAITSTVLLHTLKRVIGRERPALPLLEELTNYSFPSGHALSSFIFCAVLIWLTWKGNWKRSVKIILCLFLLSWSLAIGVSRIVIRYHYASDVIAGFLMGFAWVILSFYIQRKIGPRNHRIE